MTGRNDHAIIDALEAMSHVTSQALQNQNGMIDEFCGLSKFQRNNTPTSKARYDPEGAQVWLQKIVKIFRVITCIDAHKVLFGTHMLAEETKYWWDNAHQRLEAAGYELRVPSVSSLRVACIQRSINSSRYQEIHQFSVLVNKCRIYEEDSCVKSVHYKSVSEKKGGNQNRRKPYVSLADKGKWKASYGKETNGGGTPAYLRCFSYGGISHCASDYKSSSQKCFKCGELGHRIADYRVIC
ncbi:uncharacterized protein LOC127137614 [Lathyrus oleraceus]|uniref:uncharacterized protein LOC127137614 n=1 Tax=Pisum sativum TaxID=3888 RepID=UPI0021D3B008|nr:uncharacterized protein LOC127137614 [Pisum sativum]